MFNWKTLHHISTQEVKNNLSMHANTPQLISPLQGTGRLVHAAREPQSPDVVHLTLTSPKSPVINFTIQPTEEGTVRPKTKDHVKQIYYKVLWESLSECWIAFPPNVLLRSEADADWSGQEWTH